MYLILQVLASLVLFSVLILYPSVVMILECLTFIQCFAKYLYLITFLTPQRELEITQGHKI